MTDVLVSIIASSRARSRAQELALRLERNLSVRALVIAESAAPITETWEEGSHAGALILLLDTESCNAAPRRQEWQGILDAMHSQPICFGLLEPCRYPSLLERGKFLDASHQLLFARQTEAWIAKLLEPGEQMQMIPAAEDEPESWWNLLVDQPGHVRASIGEMAAAQSFAARARRNFQALLWIASAGRSPQAVQGELEHRAPRGRTLVVLAGSPESSTLAWDRGGNSLLELSGDAGGRLVCSSTFPGWFAHQCLGSAEWRGTAVALDEAARFYRLPAGQHSFSPQARRRHFDTTCNTFTNWRRDRILCQELLHELPTAVAYGLASDWPAAGALCWQVSLWLLREGRKREAREWLTVLRREATLRGDSERAEEAAAELSWLEERPLLHSPVQLHEQMSLF